MLLMQEIFLKGCASNAFRIRQFEENANGGDEPLPRFTLVALAQGEDILCVVLDAHLSIDR